MQNDNLRHLLEFFILFFKITLMLFFEQTGVALGVEIEDKMPQHEYYEYFGPDYTLHVAPSNMENKNSRQLLDEIKIKLLDNLSKLQHAPSVQFQERPPDTEIPEVCIAKFLALFVVPFSVTFTGYMILCLI